MRDRGMGDFLDFSKRREKLNFPSLLAVQIDSYNEFLQSDVPPDKREEKGLEAVFKEIFPVEDTHGEYTLSYVSYSIKHPRVSVSECKLRKMTYGAPLRVKLRLLKWTGSSEERKLKEATEVDTYLGDIPLMTPRGTFIINGAERVIVSQLHRSPGVFFGTSFHANGTQLYSARIISYFRIAYC